LINFPDSPFVGQIYVPAGVEASWLWDGQKWNAATQGTYVLTSGGTISGNLAITGNLTVSGTTALTVATATAPPVNDNSTLVPTTSWVNVYVNTRGFATQTWVQQQGYLTVASAAGAYLPLVGGSLSGNLNLTGASYTGGTLTTQAIHAPNRLTFRKAAGDEANAGAIDYRGYDGAALSIVGAGTAGGNRAIRLFDNVRVDGSFVAAGNSTVYLGYYYKDRTNYNLDWCLYAQDGVGRLWNNGGPGDFILFYFSSGEVRFQRTVYFGSAANFRLFDDGNGHVECGTPLWLNWYTTQPVTTGGSLTVNSYLYPNGFVMPNNTWIQAKDTGGGWHGTVLLANNNHLYFGGADLATHYRGSGVIYYEAYNGGYHLFNTTMRIPNGSIYQGTDTGGAARNLLWLDGANNTYLNWGNWTIYIGGDCVIGSGCTMWSNLQVNGQINVNGQIFAGNTIWTNVDMVIGPQRYFYVRDGSWGVHAVLGFDGSWLYVGADEYWLRIRGGRVYISYLFLDNGIDYWAHGHKILFYWDNVGLECFVDGTYVGSVGGLCDARIKTNIQASTHDALAAIRALQTFSYTRIQDQREERVGLVAQQVGEIIPEAMISAPINGKDRNSEKFHTLDSFSLIAYLTGAIQQIADRLEKAEARLEALDT